MGQSIKGQKIRVAQSKGRDRVRLELGQEGPERGLGSHKGQFHPSTNYILEIKLCVHLLLFVVVCLRSGLFRLTV